MTIIDRLSTVRVRLFAIAGLLLTIMAATPAFAADVDVTVNAPKSVWFSCSGRLVLSAPLGSRTAVGQCFNGAGGVAYYNTWQGIMYLYGNAGNSYGAFHGGRDANYRYLYVRGVSNVTQTQAKITFGY